MASMNGTLIYLLSPQSATSISVSPLERTLPCFDVYRTRSQGQIAILINF